MSKALKVAFLLGFLSFLPSDSLVGEEDMNKKELEKYSWKDWKGSQICWFWGIGELWWYNSAKIFNYNCEIDYRAEDSSVFWLEGKSDKNGIFGVCFDWSWHESPELEKGYIYQFKIALQETLPDYILINGQKVWDKTTGVYEDQYIRFTYVPADNQTAKIFIVKKANSSMARMLFTRSPYFTPKLQSLRAPFKGNIPVYENMKVPEFKLLGIDPAVASGRLEKYSDDPADLTLKPLPQVDYPTAKINAIEGIIRTSDKSLLENVKNSGSNIWYNRESGESFKKYAETVKAAGMDAMFQPLILNEKGEYHGNHWIRFLAKGKLAAAEKDTVNGLNEFLKLYPECKTVYIWYPEFNSILGAWSGGIHNSPMKNLSEKWKRILEGNSVQAFEKIFEYWNAVSTKIKNVKEGKIKIIFLNTGTCPNAAYGFKCGADIIMTKQIHRQNMNIAVANARGAASAYDKEYGFDNDCWERCYIHAFHPEEVTQNLFTYFYAGGQYILNEFNVINKNGDLTYLGRIWFEIIRQVKLHPERGEQQVRIAIMRGLPDEWNRACGPSTSWESANESHEVTRQDYFTDYNLLNIFFSNFGNYYRTFPDRQSTGTPYGPVDFIPWDTAGKKLENYELIVYLGKSTCMDETQYKNLKNYVKNGGILVMAAGQLRNDNGKFFKEDLSDLFGVKISGDFTLKEEPRWDRERMTWTFPEGKKKYTQLKITDPKAEVFYRLKNSDPYVVLNRLGKGKAYLFTTEYLTEFDEATATRVLMPECEKIKSISFSPESSWLEYMVQKKGNCYILPIFNHGNVGFPSGNGKKTGPWNGKVTLDLDKFAFPKGKLEVYESIYVPDEKIPYKLVKIDSVQENGKLSFNIKIDKFSEIVIGISGKVEKEYFSPKNSK